MKVEKFIELDPVEVVVHLDHEDIRQALLEDQNNVLGLLRTLSNFASYLEAFDAEIINEMTSEQRQITHDFLIEKAAKFK